MSKLVAEYLQHPLSASANIALLDDGNVGGVLGATLGSKLNIAGGKILQIVRATDTTNRSTTSTSYVDVTGMSITITPQKSDSTIFVFATGAIIVSAGSQVDVVATVRITDSSNTPLSGAESTIYRVRASGGADRFATNMCLVGAVGAGSTSVRTYKLRFLTFSPNTVELSNGQTTGAMLAIEVSA